MGNLPIVLAGCLVAALVAAIIVDRIWFHERHREGQS